MCVLDGTTLKQQYNEYNSIELINGKSQTNKHQKLNLLILQQHDQFQKFWLKFVKNRQKELQRGLHYNKKIGDCENIYSVNPLYLLVNPANGYLEENNGNKYLIFDDSVYEN